MTTNFLNLLKSKNLGSNQAIKIDSNFGTKDQTIVDVTPQGYGPDPIQPVTTPILIRCERVIDRNRLDLFFSVKPSEETRDLLKDQGFKFNPDTLAWYHKDTTSNRLFLANTFNLSELMIDSFNDDLKPDQVATPYDCDAVSPEFAKYRNQVDQLIEKLKIRPADLMLHAMDCLYIQTFKVN